MAHHGGHNRQMWFPERVKARQEEAVARNAAYQALSLEDRLARLDALGMTAQRQRAALQAAIARRDVQEPVRAIEPAQEPVEHHARTHRNDKKARKKVRT